MLARTLTYWTILKICVEERLVYRGDFALGTLMRFMPIVRFSSGPPSLQRQDRSILLATRQKKSLLTIY